MRSWTEIVTEAVNDGRERSAVAWRNLVMQMPPGTLFFWYEVDESTGNPRPTAEAMLFINLAGQTLQEAKDYADNALEMLPPEPAWRINVLELVAMQIETAAKSAIRVLESSLLLAVSMYDRASGGQLSDHELRRVYETIEWLFRLEIGRMLRDLDRQHTEVVNELARLVTLMVGAPLVTPRSWTLVAEDGTLQPPPPPQPPPEAQNFSLETLGEQIRRVKDLLSRIIPGE